MIDKRILRKSYRILVLSLGIVALAAILGVFRWQEFVSKKKKIVSGTQGVGFSEETILPELKEFPDVGKFGAFLYPNSGPHLSISGTCSDTYYAILIFRAQDDYRKDPSAAKMNRAAECPSSRRFSQTIALKDINLPSGSYYYFTADQGTSGSWYNPR